jgi:hypothetical protein
VTLAISAVACLFHRMIRPFADLNREELERELSKMLDIPLIY